MTRKIIFLILILLSAKTLWARDWDPRLLEASRLIYQGDANQADALISQYISDNPKEPNGYFVKGVVMEWKAALEGRNPSSVQREIVKLYERAADNAFQLWHQDEENLDRMTDLGNAYIFLARKYADIGENLKAVLTGKKCQKYLEGVLKKDPKRTDGLLSLGGFHYLAASTSPALSGLKALLGIKGSKEQGLAELKRSLNGNHPFVNDTLYALFFINLDHEKNYDQALFYLGELEKKFPNNPEMKFKHGLVNEKQDRMKGAVAYIDFTKWCEANKSQCNPTYLFLGNYHAARLFKDLGEKAKAKEYFAKAALLNNQAYPQMAAEALVWPADIESAEGQILVAYDKLKKAQSLPNLNKNMRKEIDAKLSQACQAPEIASKC